MASDRLSHISPLLVALQEAAAENSVYVMSRPDRCVKIGRSRHPKTRASTLSRTLGVKVRVEYSREMGLNALAGEKILHLMFPMHRQDGEWFAISVDVAIAAVDATAEALGRAVTPLKPEGAKRDRPTPSMSTGRLSKSELKTLILAYQRGGVSWDNHKAECDKLYHAEYVERVCDSGRLAVAVVTQKGEDKLKFEMRLIWSA